MNAILTRLRDRLYLAGWATVFASAAIVSFGLIVVGGDVALMLGLLFAAIGAGAAIALVARVRIERSAGRSVVRAAELLLEDHRASTA